MAIQYPDNLTSEYPIYMRKAVKLAHFIADDYINWKDGTDDVEWVPDLIQVTVGRHAEDDPELFTLIFKANDASLELWFKDEENPSLDVDSMFEECINLKGDDSADTSEANLTKWVNEVESILSNEMDEEEVVGRFYEDGELLDKDWNENISQSYESENE